MHRNRILALIAASLLCAPLAACKTTNASDDEMVAEPMADENDTFAAEGEAIAEAKNELEVEVIDPPGDVYMDAEAMAPVYFAFDSAELTDADRVVLDQTAAELREDAAMAVTVAGHADEVGSDEANRELGMKRAEAVKDYLVSAGIEAERLNTISYGETKPAVPTPETQRHWRNRRVEFEAQEGI